MIPYADILHIQPKTVDGIYRVCPVCKKVILELADPLGELTTNNYGDHYVKEHS